MDTLRAVNELMTEGHFDREQSETLARVMQGLWSSEVATKSDIIALRGGIESVRVAMATKDDLGAVKQDVAAVKADVALLRSEMASIETRLNNKLYGLALTIVIAMGVIQHYFK